jgi:hypothetical protein
MADERLSIASIHDVNGNSLVMEADDALQRLEDFYLAHLERTQDVPGKAGKIVIELEVLPTGPSGRVLDFAVDVKYPSTATKRTQQAASVDGVIYPMQVPQQYTIEDALRDGIKPGGGGQQQ